MRPVLMSKFNKRVVCHITSVHRAFDVRIFHKQCKTLSGVGFSVVLVAVGNEEDTIVEGVKVKYVKPPSNRLVRVFFTSFKVAVRAYTSKASVYHMHDPELLPLALLFSLIGKKVIFDFHEDVEAKLIEREWLAKPLRAFTVKIFKLLSSAGAKLFAAKIAATPKIASMHSGKVVEVIANYPVASLLAEETPDIPYRADNFDLIYTGGWSQNRGARELVNSMEYVKHPQVKLVVIGQIQPEEQEYVRKLEGYKRVADLGRVAYEDSIEQMQKSAIGLVCSQNGHGYEDALPNKLFEYMALGLPVIASEFTLWKDLLEEYESVIFVDPSNLREIAEAIDFLINNPERRREMGIKGTKAIKEKFSWEKEGKKLVNLYEGIL